MGCKVKPVNDRTVSSHYSERRGSKFISQKWQNSPFFRWRWSHWSDAQMTMRKRWRSVCPCITNKLLPSYITIGTEVSNRNKLLSFCTIILEHFYTSVCDCDVINGRTPCISMVLFVPSDQEDQNWRKLRWVPRTTSKKKCQRNCSL